MDAMETMKRAKEGRKEGMNFTGLGTEVEAIIAGVIAYLAMGAFMLVFCCVMSKIWIWNRARQIRKKRSSDGFDDTDFATAVLEGNMEFDNEA